MSPATFERELRARLPEGGRPFVCDGSPFDCEAFVVGFNPATKHDIWPYWSATDGRDKAAWYAGYLAERGGSPSRTRGGLQQVEAAARPVRLLETNIHSVPSKEAADLPPGLRTTDAFEYLLESVRPRAVYAHGAPARDWLADRYGLTLSEGDEAAVDVDGTPLTILTSRHLSRASYDVARTAGARLRELCAQP